MRRLLLASAGLAVAAYVTPAHASIAYQNTTTLVTTFVFNGATTVNPATNIDINLLTLAPGYAGSPVNTISFNAFNNNSSAVSSLLVFDVWAANGAGGLPGTLLASATTGPQSLAAGSQTTVSVTFAPGTLIVPASDTFYVGVGYTNGTGASLTATQLNNLGGDTFNPATIGTNSAQAYFAAPGTTGSNPAVLAFGTPFQADYGFAVDVPEPASFSLLLTGLAASGLRFSRRLRHRRSFT